jgi:uncharacterized protein
MNPSETVREIYAAFAAQDIPAIMQRVAEDVEWEYAYTTDEIPWLAPRRGLQGVLSFSQALQAGLSLKNLQVNAMLGQDDVVIALIDLEAVVTITGRTILECDEVHIWRFDERGKVARFRHASDTLQHFRALAP